MIATAPTPSFCCPSLSSLGSDVISIHANEEALEDLLGANEIPLELGLVFLPHEIQHLYQAHQVVQREALSHSPAHKVELALDTNGTKRDNRYRTPMPYALFKELLETQIPSLSHPAPGLLKVQTLSPTSRRQVMRSLPTSKGCCWSLWFLLLTH